MLLLLYMNVPLPTPTPQSANLVRPSAGFRDSASTLRMLSPERAERGGLPGAAGGGGTMKLLRVGQQGSALAGRRVQSMPGGGLGPGAGGGRLEEGEAGAAASRDVRLLRVGRSIGGQQQVSRGGELARIDLPFLCFTCESAVL